MTDTTALELPNQSHFADVANPQVQSLQVKERETLLKQIGGGIRLTPEQVKLLAREATLEVIDVLPTGEIYVPGDKWRLVLNETFSPMGWGLRPGQPHLDLQENQQSSVLYREAFLVVSRCNKCMLSLNACQCKASVAHKYEPWCVSTAIGAQNYFPGNKRMTYDDAVEGSTTNSLMRCCKPFGVYANIWDRTWAEQAKAAIAIQVSVKPPWARDTKLQWRRKDAPPFDGELGAPHHDHPPAPAKPHAPPVAPPQALEAAKEEPKPKDGEKILVCRAVNYDKDGVPSTYWVVNSDFSVYVTDDKSIVTGLENGKARGLRFHITSETIGVPPKQRKRILEYRPAGDVK